MTRINPGSATAVYASMPITLRRVPGGAAFSPGLFLVPVAGVKDAAP